MLPPHLPRQFQTTRWTLVRRATGKNDPAAEKALGELCEMYWFPIYSYIRRCGHSAQNAEDLTQGFFAQVLERQTFARANQSKGKLRTFLLTCVRNYLHNEHERAGSQRRGGHLVVQLDQAAAEECLLNEPSDDLPPDRQYQRRWALTLLSHSLQLLEREYQEQGKGELFCLLSPYLGLGDESVASYAELSTRLNCSVGSLRTHVSRLRRRWRVIIFEQVSQTLDDPTNDEIKAELSDLMGCV
jgi:RNA polymerase sigma factor (sigma-70 family)